MPLLRPLLGIRQPDPAERSRACRDRVCFSAAAQRRPGQVALRLHLARNCVAEPDLQPGTDLPDGVDIEVIRRFDDQAGRHR